MCVAGAVNNTTFNGQLYKYDSPELDYQCLKML